MSFAIQESFLIDDVITIIIKTTSRILFSPTLGVNAMLNFITNIVQYFHFQQKTSEDNYYQYIIMLSKCHGIVYVFCYSIIRNIMFCISMH